MLPKLLKSYRLKRKRRKVGEAGAAISSVLVNSKGQEICTLATADVDYIARRLRGLRKTP